MIIEKYYSKLTLDFHTNKRVTGEVAIIPSKRMRNKIAGFITHLMKRIQRGPVRGISLKLQEEEREARLDFVPEVQFETGVMQWLQHTRANSSFYSWTSNFELYITTEQNFPLFFFFSTEIRH